VNPRFSDDMSNRILFFKEVFPPNYVQLKGETDEVKAWWKGVEEQMAKDAARLRATQRPDGMWQFDPGTFDEKSKSWRVKDDEKDVDPAPTALAIMALHALGADDKDPQVKRAVEAMLRMTRNEADMAFKKRVRTIFEWIDLQPFKLSSRASHDNQQRTNLQFLRTTNNSQPTTNNQQLTTNSQPLTG
jgi:hypothetical protein